MQKGIMRTSSRNSTVVSKRRVSFYPYTKVLEFPPVSDPGIKNQLYYSSHDLFIMKETAKLEVSYWFGQRKQKLLLRSREQNQLQHYNYWYHHQQQRYRDTSTRYAMTTAATTRKKRRVHYNQRFLYPPSNCNNYQDQSRKRIKYHHFSHNATQLPCSGSH